MSGSPLSPKLPTVQNVALYQSKLYASVHGGGALRHLELAPSIYTIYLSSMIMALQGIGNDTYQRMFGLDLNS